MVQVTGVPTTPEPVLNLYSSSPVLASNAFRIAFRSTGEHQTTSGGHDATPKRGRCSRLTPDFFAGFWIHRAEHTDVVIVGRLDGESPHPGTQRLSCRRLARSRCPWTTRWTAQIEQASLLAVSHRHPVLATQEGRLNATTSFAFAFAPSAAGSPGRPPFSA